MNNKPKNRINGKFAKKKLETPMSMEKITKIQEQILDGFNDVNLITEAFNYLYPERKDELLNYPFKRKMVFLYGKFN